MSARNIAGENTPLWWGAGLIALGLASWTGAAAAAQAERAEHPVLRAQNPAVSPDTTALAPSSHLDPVLELEAPVRPPVEPAPERLAEPAAKPCAPVVELRFASGASEVADADALRTIVAAAQRFGEKRVVVEGYVSATGSPARNLALSHRRARKAKSKLLARGLTSTRVSVQAFGEYRPNLAGDEDRDRRVVIKLEGMPECPESPENE